MIFQGNLNPEWNVNGSSLILEVFKQSRAPLDRAVIEEMRKYGSDPWMPVHGPSASESN